jgi:hypothetical protein
VPVYVRDMPFSDRPRDLAVLGVAVRAFAYEPVVWVSLTPHEVTALPADAPRFPAVVDTGNTLALNIREGHFTAWSGTTCCCTGSTSSTGALSAPLSVYFRSNRLGTL